MRVSLKLVRRQRAQLLSLAAFSVAGSAELARAQLVVTTFNGSGGADFALINSANYNPATSPSASILADVTSVAGTGGSISSLSVIGTDSSAGTSVTLGALTFDTAASSGIYFDSTSNKTNVAATMLTLGGGNTGSTSPTTAAGDLITLTSSVNGLVDIRGFDGGTSNPGGGLTLATPSAGGNFDIAANSTLEIGSQATISGTGAITVTGGGTLTIYGTQAPFTGGFVVNGSTLATLTNTSFALGTTDTTTLSSGTLILAASTVVGVSHPITISGGGGTISSASGTGSVELAGLISGSGTLTKIGAGTAYLEYYGNTGGTNSFNGGLAVNAGTLQISSQNDIRNSTGVTLNNATFAYSGITGVTSTSIANTTSFTLGGTVDAIDVGTTGGAGGTSPVTLQIGATPTGAGGLLKTGVGTLLLPGSTASGGLTSNAGTLSVAGPVTSTGGITINGGFGSFSSTVGGTGGVTVTGGSLSLAGTETYSGATSVSGGTLNVTGPVSATSGITVGTGGTLFLDGYGGGGSVASTFTGPVAVNGGTLQISSHNDLLDTPSITLNSGTLAYVGVAGTGIGTTVATSTTLTLNGTLDDINVGTNSTSNPITLQINATASGTGGLLKTDVGTLILAGSSASGGLTNNGGFLSVSGTVSGSGGVTVNAGEVLLQATGTYSGATTINGGSLSVSSTNFLGSTASPTSLTLNGGTLQYTSSSVGPASSVANRTFYIGANGGTISSTGTATLTINGTVVPATTLVTSGTLDVTSGTIGFAGSGINGVPLFVGPTSGSGGATTYFSYSTAALSSLASSGTGTASVVLGYTTSPGASTTLTIGSDGTNTQFAGVISDRTSTISTAIGNIVKTGSGVLTLSGNNTYTGTTKAYGGSLLVTGSNTGTGAVTVGDGGSNAGTFGGGGSVAGNVTVNSNGTIVSGGAAVGTFTDKANLTFASGGATLVEKIASDSSADQVAVTKTGSSLAFSGGNNSVQLNLVSIAGFVPLASDTYTLISTGGASNSDISGFSQTVYGGTAASPTVVTPGTFFINVSALPSFYDISQAVINDTGGNITITGLAPEPASGTLIVFGLTHVMLRRRRRCL